MPAKRRFSKAIVNLCPSTFDDDRPVSRERWQRWRDELMAKCRAGTRPPEWWEYESPEPRSDDRDLPESIQLFDMGELRPDEIEELAPFWCKHFERAQDP